MEIIRMIAEWIWDWSRTVFGTIFVACILMSLALLVIELIIYRVKTDDGTQGFSGRGQSRGMETEISEAEEEDGVQAAYMSSASGIEHNDWLISPAINASEGKETGMTTAD